MMVHDCNPSCLGRGGGRLVSLRPNWAVSEMLSLKQNTNKRAGSM
jgi:hypothetical protein